MNVCFRPKETNASHFGESALDHTFKMLLRKVLSQQSFWNFVKSFLTNKSCYTQNDIMLIDTGGKVIVIGSDLVETFNDHYINIVEKFGRQTLQICF